MNSYKISFEILLNINMYITYAIQNVPVWYAANEKDMIPIGSGRGASQYLKNSLFSHNIII
jgi:hypothetical protein